MNLTKNENRTRIVWVDNVKVIACILVALGHLVKGFVSAGLMDEGLGYKIFNDVIYCFHVPLFFICSGFLYQQFTKEQTAKSYAKGILKKLISLGVPYFVFSTATYILKTVFSSQVNFAPEDNLATMLFLNPTAPYWFLYSLFFMFLLSPIIKGKTDAIIRIVIGVALYALSSFSLLGFVPDVIFNPVDNFCKNYIWFALGMVISRFNFSALYKKWLIGAFLLFLGVKICTVVYDVELGVFALVLSFLACVGVIGFVGDMYKSNKQTKLFGILSKYTMPIFLMHTIVSSGFRAVLLKIGITSLSVHIVVGLITSIVLPIVAGMIMEKIKLDILYNPTKYIKIK